MLAEVVDRCPPAPRSGSRHPLDHVDPALQPVAFVFPAGLFVRALVDVAVMGDLVTALEDGLDEIRILLHAPCGKEECLFETEAAVEFEYPLHRDPVVAEQ